MKVAPLAISSFARFILGGEIFNHLLSIVTFQQTSAQKSGEEKKAHAISEFRAIGFELANWALNLGIELAVAYLKALENRNK